MPRTHFTYRIHTLITAPEIDTDLLWGLSIFFAGLAGLYFMSVFFFRNKISSKSSRTKLRKTELAPMISEFLFYEEDAEKSEKSKYIELKITIRELLRDDFNRKILAEILLDLRKDVSGDTQRRLFKLYQDLGLEKDAFKKLSSWRWEVVSKGVLELTLMQVGDAYGFIVKFINDRRATIRKQAEIATVSLKPGGIDYFLDTTKYRISEWQQLKLLDVLRNKEDFEPPRFKAWLTSTNKHVVLFALRLIKYYNQNDANISLVELVKHKDQQVKRQAIACIKEFFVVEALPTLKGVFWKCSVDIKIAILGAVAELGTEQDIEFLETVSQREGNFSVKSKAVGAINTIAPESVMPTENIEHITAYQVPEKRKEPDEPRQTPKAVINPIPNEIETPMPSENQFNQALRSIDIEFEEVLPNTFDSQENHSLTSIETENVNAIEVHSIKMISETADEELEALVAEIKEIAFLPFVVDEETSKDGEAIVEGEVLGNDEVLKHPQEQENTENAESLNHIEGYSLSDFEISFKEKKLIEIPEEAEKEEEEEEAVTFNLEEEPIIEVANPHVENVLSWIMADNELRNIECNYESVPYGSHKDTIEGFSAQPVYYDEHEAYMMGLLDDLEELGDHREISLLEELRAEESKNFIKDRIDGIIEKFTRQHKVKKGKTIDSKEEPINLPVFSVFADLFKSIDTESKLILLDEVVVVGDEKEIEFLDGLLEDPDQKIRDKAQTVLKQLIAKLSRENPAASYSIGVSAIVAEQIKNDDALSEQIYDSLLSELDINTIDNQLKTSGNGLESSKSDPDTSKIDLSTACNQPMAPKNHQDLKNPPFGILPNSGTGREESSTSDNNPIFEIDFEICEVLDKKCDPEILDMHVVATEVSPNGDNGSFFGQMRNFTKLFF